MSETPISEMRCRYCGYDLRATETRQCPECGTVFVAGNSSTYLTKPQSGRTALKLSVWGLICIATPIVLAVASSMTQARQPDEAPYVIVLLGLSGVVLCTFGLIHGAPIAFGRPAWIIHRKEAVAAVLIGGPIVVMFALLMLSLGMTLMLR